MQAIHGNPHHQPLIEGTAGPRPSTAPSGEQLDNADATGGTPVDQVDLSAAAKQFLHGAGPGKSAQSPAHQARAAIADNDALSQLPFGKVVSAINHGTIDALIQAQEPVEPAAAEGTDPATSSVVVENPAGAEGAAATETEAETAAETGTVQDVLPPDTEEVILEELVTNQEEPDATEPAVTTDPVEPATTTIQTLEAPAILVEADTEVSILDLLTDPEGDPEDDPEDQQSTG
jgi:hypothetical protein